MWLINALAQSIHKLEAILAWIDNAETKLDKMDSAQALKRIQNVIN